VQFYTHLSDQFAHHSTLSGHFMSGVRDATYVLDGLLTMNPTCASKNTTPIQPDTDHVRLHLLGFRFARASILSRASDCFRRGQTLGL